MLCIICAQAKRACNSCTNSVHALSSQKLPTRLCDQPIRTKRSRNNFNNVSVILTRVLFARAQSVRCICTRISCALFAQHIPPHLRFCSPKTHEHKFNNVSTWCIRLQLSHAQSARASRVSVSFVIFTHDICVHVACTLIINTILIPFT